MAERPVAFRGGGFHYLPNRVIAWIAFAVVVAVWQVLSSVGWLSPLALPSPRAIVVALYELAASGKLFVHVAASLERIVVGWLLGTLVGLTVGLAMGIFSTARSLGLPFISALFPIPKIALLPLLIVWFGIGEPSKIAVIAFGVFFPTVISAYNACDNVPRNLIRMGQSFNLPALAIVRSIIIPGAMPGILAGFRITASIALILVVAAEMIAAQEGIGAFVLSAGNLMQTDQLLAGVVLLSVLGLLIATLLSHIEAWVLRWR
jgi:NitT/TauT family transport system permease protein